MREPEEGGYCGKVTPVPIPNTEVKLICADGTAWVTVWKSRSLPSLNALFFFIQTPDPCGWEFFVLYTVKYNCSDGTAWVIMWKSRSGS